MHVLRTKKCLTWMGACVAWVGIILISSTSWAGRVSDRAFTRYITRHIRPYDKYDLYSRYHAHFLAEKDVHLIMFVVLGILLWRILPEMPSKAMTVFLLGALVGCCSELAQSLFPGRDPAVRDALINAAGTGIGTGISWFRSDTQALRRAWAVTNSFFTKHGVS